MHGKNHTGDEEADCGRAASRARRTWMSLTPGHNQLRSKFGHQIIGWKAAFVLLQTVMTRGDTHCTNLCFFDVLKNQKRCFEPLFPKKYEYVFLV